MIRLPLTDTVYQGCRRKLKQERMRTSSGTNAVPPHEFDTRGVKTRLTVIQDRVPLNFCFEAVETDKKYDITKMMRVINTVAFCKRMTMETAIIYLFRLLKANNTVFISQPNCYVKFLDITVENGSAVEISAESLRSFGGAQTAEAKAKAQPSRAARTGRSLFQGLTGGGSSSSRSAPAARRDTLDEEAPYTHCLFYDEVLFIVMDVFGERSMRGFAQNLSVMVKPLIDRDLARIVEGAGMMHDNVNLVFYGSNHSKKFASLCDTETKRYLLSDCIDLSVVPEALRDWYVASSQTIIETAEAKSKGRPSARGR